MGIHLVLIWGPGVLAACVVVLDAVLISLVMRYVLALTIRL